MNSRLVPFVLIIAIYLALSMYNYYGMRSIFSDVRSLNIFKFLYLAATVFVLFCFYRLYVSLSSGNIFRNTSANFYLGIVFTALFTHVVFGVLLLFQDGARLLYGFADYLKNAFGSEQASEASHSYLPSRRRFFTLLSAGIATIPMFSMLYGITKGKYNFKIKKTKIAFTDLPVAFDGFKIVQISDIHAGSIDSIEALEHAVMMINDQQADLVLFTGDMVNSDKDEANPYIETLKKMQAKHGKFAVLGNHDYYGSPRVEILREGYWQDFFRKFENMNLQLLNNANQKIHLGSESINIVGVENWGAGHWFPKRGDLDQALQNTSAKDFNILLSHDPTHWDEKVLSHPRKIHLTLSGHTHGFQFGINIPGFRWSPAKYRYPRWMGLYEEQGRYLYVNPGLGFLGFPGRVGIWPEITVIELTRVG